MLKINAKEHFHGNSRPIQWVLGALSGAGGVVKRSKSEADHSLPTNGVVMNVWS